MTEVIEGAAYRRHDLLLGFLSKAEVDAIFAQNPLRLRAGQTAASAHSVARTARSRLGLYEPGSAEALPGAVAPLAEEIRRGAVFKKEYEAKGDYEFVSVPIASLLSPQMNLDFEYVNELAGKLTPEVNDAADFVFAFPSGEIGEPIVKGNTVVFTSHAPNIAVSAVPVLRRTDSGFEVVFEAKGRPNFVMVARINGRLVLHNGVHKVLALLSRGRSRTFAVLHDLQDQNQLGLGQANLSMFAEANYTNGGRPPLVEDFNGPAAVQVLARATVNVYRLFAQTEDILAPALKAP